MTAAMFTARALFRVAAAALVAVALVLRLAPATRAQTIPAVDTRITYILPQWLGFLSASTAAVAQQVAELRSRIGEGPRVRVGFTTYVNVSMDPVDPSDTASIQAALTSTLSQMDAAIARGVANNIPVCLSFITAIRDSVDSLQTQAQDDDRRNMQWYSDNSMATGWTTYSRYARTQEVIQEAYIRELGRQLAKRMAANPDILVAASGDGEIELALPPNGNVPLDQLVIADYSPFAVAEFRDWLRGTGLYAAGQPFAGEAYSNAARYASDASITTLNSDFALNFDTWKLKYFDWSLSDSTSPDPNAIPATQYTAPEFDPKAVSNANGFDPPRVHQRGNAWSDLWDQFRQAMVYRHNREFAKWITTSADPSTGATVPVDRWFTDQIPGDYLFGGTPANPNGRFDTSASSIATADVSPYGSLGITSFNVDLSLPPGPSDPESAYARTLVGAAPAIAARKVRWGIFEWNPAVGPTADTTIYSDETSLVKQYHPSVLAPFLWDPQDPSTAQFSVEGTPFETALRNLVNDLDNVPLGLSRTTLDVAAISTGAAMSPPQTIRVTGAPGETPAWSITSAPTYLDVVPAADGRSFTVALKPATYPAGVVVDTITVTPSTPGYAPATLAVTRRVSLPGTTQPPEGTLDTPAENALVAGEVPFTGWAMDDIGIAGVAICRAPVAGEATPPTPSLCGGLNNIFVGSGTFVPNARTDVAAAFPGLPMNDQAGWGYMLLSNMLPNGGNGLFTMSVVATDVEGHSVEIAERHINGQNAASSLPFGTIDTPTQGQTVSGTIVNFGWALAQPGKDISADSSTIDVLIDGVTVGHPGSRAARGDITAAFPAFVTDHAVGGYVLDTTTLANGLHSIAWIVSDSSGATQGVGSRFFTVANP